MVSSVPRRHSLKSRITLFTLLIFLFSLWSLSFYASQMLRQDMERLLSEQQFSNVTLIAAEVNAQLDVRLRVLEVVAGSISPASLRETKSLQGFLDGLPILHGPFNGGVMALGLNGTALADTSKAAERIGVDYSDNSAVVSALREGKRAISRPVIGRVLKKPGFILVVPIYNAKGEVLGALAGVTLLDLPNFLDKVTENRFGKTGSYVIAAPEHRVIVTASDKSKVLSRLPGPGRSPLTDRFINGDEGSVVFTDATGVELLTSAKHIPLSNWEMVAILPTEEAFAPIHAMQQRMLVATLLLTLLAAVLTWWMLRRQLSPLLSAAKRLSRQCATDQPVQALPIARPDEIGALIGGFNGLLETLGQREEALREQKEFFHLIAENIGDFIAVLDRDGKRLYNSPSYRKFFAPSTDMHGTDSFHEIHPDDQERVKQVFRETVQSGIGRQINYRLLMADGKVREMESVGSTIKDRQGRVERVVVVSRDVTERKQMEDHVRQLAFHDALTELPNRRLLKDRLAQAMAASARSHCYGALMFLDLDNFKPLNDAHGHEVGDLLLIEVARRLKNCVRHADTVARFGGDEFVVMLSKLEVDKEESAAQARIIADKIRCTLSEPYRLSTESAEKVEKAVENSVAKTVEHHCSVSLGVILFIGDELSQEEILKWADEAMYQAKAAGRNSIRFYDTDVH
jgi:diguanylate cyclase (GGDEF)-like protein/PAS domain S-box-containing protein